MGFIGTPKSSKYLAYYIYKCEKSSKYLAYYIYKCEKSSKYLAYYIYKCEKSSKYLAYYIYKCEKSSKYLAYYIYKCEKSSKYLAENTYMRNHFFWETMLFHPSCTLAAWCVPDSDLNSCISDLCDLDLSSQGHDDTSHFAELMNLVLQNQYTVWAHDVAPHSSDLHLKFKVTESCNK